MTGHAAAASRSVVVVGASAAGLRCACRLKRLQPAWQVVVIEEREAFSYAACGLPYLLSGDVEDAAALRSTADGALRDVGYFADVKGIEVRSGRRVTAVDPAGRTVRSVGRNGDEEAVAWDDLVLATGARARRLREQPVHPRVGAVHTLEDVEPLQRQLAGGRLSHAVVIGAGLLGCELAEAFRALWGAEVTLLEAAPHVLPGVLDPAPAAVVAAALEHHGVRTLPASPVLAIHAGETGVRVEIPTGSVAADAAVVAIGAEPAVELARMAGVALGPTGAIAVDDRLATSVPGIWAAGDCIEVVHAVTGRPAWLPLGSLANRQGRTLANVLGGRHDRFPAVAGAAAAKVFDANVAAAGCTVTAAAACGLQTRAAWITAQDRPHYWPEAAELAIQIVYEPETHRLLGVQVVGPGDAVSRVNAATPYLHAGARLEELAHLEHAYAPPYAPALEPLAVAAMVALEQEHGARSLEPLTDVEGRALLDVRHDHERAARPCAGDATVWVPLDRLRATPLATRPEAVVCERGIRSAEAARRLDAAYLAGGLRWRDGLGWRRSK